MMIIHLSVINARDGDVAAPVQPQLVLDLPTLSRLQGWADARVAESAARTTSPTGTTSTPTPDRS